MTPTPDPDPVAVMPPSEKTADDTEGEDEGFIEICVRKKTRVRVNYRPCDDAEPGYAWYFLKMDKRVPATGAKVKKGSFEQPSGDSHRAPSKGGLAADVLIADIEDRVEVCVSKRTRVRVADIRCDDGEKGYAWYYIRIDGYVPPTGKKATDGSYRTPYAEAYRARRKGGDAVKAAIDYEDPNAPEEEEEEEYCTTTINGECVATNNCTETVNGVCTDTGDDQVGTFSGGCRNTSATKRRARRC